MAHVREFRASDAHALARIFHDAIHIGAADAYDAEARSAWCPKLPEGSAWSLKLTEAVTFVAENAEGPVGFMSLLPGSGHIDLAFVHPDHMRKGVASALCSRLETHALHLGLPELTTDASLLAEPMFLAQGWTVLRRQSVERHGVTLRNCRMKKALLPTNLHNLGR